MSMGLSSWKQKAINLKNKVVEMKDKTVSFTAGKVAKSGLSLKTQGELDILIAKSENKTITTKDGELKTFIKRSVLLVGDSSEKVFESILLSTPMIVTKTFAQNLNFKILDLQNHKVDLVGYDIASFPAVLVFEDKALYKIIVGEKNIKKITNSLSLDVNKAIDEIDTSQDEDDESLSLDDPLSEVETPKSKTKKATKKTTTTKAAKTKKTSPKKEATKKTTSKTSPTKKPTKTTKPKENKKTQTKTKKTTTKSQS